MAGLDASLWRALAVFRVLTLLYAAALTVASLDQMLRPAVAVAAVAVMTAWTALSVRAYGRAPLRPLLVGDLAVTCALVIGTLLAQTPARIDDGAPTLPTVWGAAPVLAWAAAWGPVGGAAAAAAVGAADLVERGRLTFATVDNVVLLVLAGVVVGQLVRLVRRAEATREAAVAAQAAAVERERLARAVHDGVLQVLALVSRRGREIGGAAADLARLAGDQEAALRAFVTSRPAAAPAESGRADLRVLLGAAAARPGVTLSAPAEPVLLPTAAARELAAAVGAALDNVARHVGDGALAWVLVEDDGDDVLVTVRDDGPGIAPGRLEQAAAEGRMGVAGSMRDRVAELGGTTLVTSRPGEGTEVELRVPRN